jgi:hypothetical protein
VFAPAFPDSGTLLVVLADVPQAAFQGVAPAGYQGISAPNQWRPATTAVGTNQHSMGPMSGPGVQPRGDPRLGVVGQMGGPGNQRGQFQAIHTGGLQGRVDHRSSQPGGSDGQLRGTGGHMDGLGQSRPMVNPHNTSQQGKRAEGNRGAVAGR